MLVCQDAKRELEKQRQADLSAQDSGSSALKDGRNRCNLKLRVILAAPLQRRMGRAVRMRSQSTQHLCCYCCCISKIACDIAAKDRLRTRLVALYDSELQVEHVE